MGTIIIVAYDVSGERPVSNNPGFFQESLLLIFFILYILYYTISEAASGGRSVGKFVTHTKVIRDDESEITWKDALIRSLCRLVPFEPFSAFGGYPWHDKWSHTKVIRINK